jgi:hypothetical protein
MKRSEIRGRPRAKDGCSLPRSLRAPVSEAYLCGPLMRLMKG